MSFIKRLSGCLEYSTKLTFDRLTSRRKGRPLSAQIGCPCNTASRNPRRDSVSFRRISRQIMQAGVGLSLQCSDPFSASFQILLAVARRLAGSGRVLRKPRGPRLLPWPSSLATPGMLAQWRQPPVFHKDSDLHLRHLTTTLFASVASASTPFRMSVQPASGFGRHGFFNSSSTSEFESKEIPSTRSGTISAAASLNRCPMSAQLCSQISTSRC